MSVVRIRPGPVYGTVRAPPSKSYTHRALVLGHLARRSFEVRHALDSDDTRATAAAVERLGTAVTRSRSAWKVHPPEGPPKSSRVAIRCGASGTTLRFTAALAALYDRPVVLDGSDRLSARPMRELVEALVELGAGCRHLRGRGLPLEVHGPIHGGRLSLDASRSSQFASALLMALPATDGNSTVRLTGPVVSEPYLEATLAVLRHHGIRVERRDRRFKVDGGQRPRGSKFVVPGDASSAAYLWAAAAVAGGAVRVTGIPEEWPQADLAVLGLLEKTGASVSRDRDGATVEHSARRPFSVDLTDSPDLYPLAGVLAATAPGTSRLSGARHVSAKESNRKVETARLARRFGARVEVSRAGLVIRGVGRPKAIDLRSLNDHRMVMSAAVGALGGSGRSTLGEAKAVGKSFPGFWTVLSGISDGLGRP